MLTVSCLNVRTVWKSKTETAAHGACAGKPMLAWELYLQQETSEKSLELLHLVANECYQAGFFLAAARAFDVLEQLESGPEYWQAKQGACAGTLQMVAAGKESPDALRQCPICFPI